MLTTPTFIPAAYTSTDQFGVDTSDPLDTSTYSVLLIVDQDDGIGNPKQATHLFTLDIICIVNTLTLITLPVEFSYTIGTGVFTTSQFIAEQDPACEYTQTFLYDVYLSGDQI